MLAKEPKNTDKYYWTEHVKFKMRFYGLSVQRVLAVIKRPKRKEEGIVKNTIAVMIPISPKVILKGSSSAKATADKETWKQEVWVMYQEKIKSQNAKIKNNLTPTLSLVRRGSKEGKQIRIISAWRYPGVSPEKNPIPQEILDEIDNIV